MEKEGRGEDGEEGEAENGTVGRRQFVLEGVEVKVGTEVDRS
jgi:hypothetical protein